jgi:Uma2 family endonuclease
MSLVEASLNPARKPHEFTYRELLEMSRAGIFGDKRVELIDGELIEMSPQNPPHAITTTELTDVLVRILGDHAKISVQNPLRLSDNLEDKHLPLPDIAVIKRQIYRDHPKPEDVYLLIEVADSSLSDDRGRKLELYAEHGVVEYWIVNLMDRHIEVYTEPKGAAYLTKRTYGLGDRFAPTRFPDLTGPWLPDDLPF